MRALSLSLSIYIMVNIKNRKEYDIFEKIKDLLGMKKFIRIQKFIKRNFHVVCGTRVAQKSRSNPKLTKFQLVLNE